MPSAAFDASLPFVLRWEGGYVDHPADPGGRTNKGVTQAVYDRWRASQGLVPRHVRLIEDPEVNAIYQTGYWMPPRCDLLRRQLDLVQFDTAVNMGVGRAVRFLQAAVGCQVDGAFGPSTAKGAAECDLWTALTAYCDAREAYYRRLAERRPELAVFLRGWLNRLNALRAEVGLPGFEAAAPLDFGDAGYIARIPDVGVDSNYDIEEP
jgi:lysozyme family protein